MISSPSATSLSMRRTQTAREATESSAESIRNDSAAAGSSCRRSQGRCRRFGGPSGKVPSGKVPQTAARADLTVHQLINITPVKISGFGEVGASAHRLGGNLTSA